MQGTGIDPSLLAELHLLESAAGADSLLEFVARANPGYVPPEHLRAVAELIVQAEYEPVRACISLPPRSGKTCMIQSAINWWLSRHPKDTAAYLTYGHDLASAKSSEALDLADAIGLKVRAQPKRADMWMTKAGGTVLARGVGGALTGFGVHLMFVDDPYKNRIEAESPLRREQIWDWFTSTALSRLFPNGSCIVVHARWHEDDIIGRLQRERSDVWKLVNIPAINDAGESIWPWLWPIEALKAKEKEVGPYDWASLYQGRPQPKGGAMFQAPVFYDKPALNGAYLLLACDPAATKNVRSDHSAIIVGAGHLGPDGLPRVDILDGWTRRVEIPELVRTLAYYQQRWRCPVAIEAVGGFKAVPQALREINRYLKVLEINPAADKYVRALPLAAAWNSGRIRLPRPEKHKWVLPLIDEVSRFTGMGDRQDDQVDALAHLYQGLAEVLRPTRPQPDFKKYLPFG